MKRINTYLAIISTLLATSMGAVAAEQAKTPALTTESQQTGSAKENTEFSDTSLKCNEEANKNGNPDKWDETFQSCMKAKGFDVSSQPSNIPAIPDSEGNEGDGL
jgi:hypothetical protein